MNKKIKSLFVGFGIALLFFITTGIVTAVISNPWFTRMIPTSYLDYLFLISTSVLIGLSAGLFSYQRQTNKTCSAVRYSGGFLGFLAFACPVCNKILVLLFGTSLLSFMEPLRPSLGLLSIVLLASVVYWQASNIIKQKKRTLNITSRSD